MKKLFIATGLALCALYSFAQDPTISALKSDASREIKKDPNDTIPSIWKKGLLFNLNFNQASLSNWAAGGDKNSLALSAFFNGYAFYKKGKNAWDNTLDLAYGVVKTTSLGSRKSDDRIDFLSKYGYEVAKSWYVSALANVRSQFAPGYSYPSDGPRQKTSNFFAPGYVLLSPGINYKPNDNFSVFVSPATARWTFVLDDYLSQIKAFGVDSGKHSKFEFGAYASVTYTKKIGTNSLYTGRLDLFSNYLKTPQDVDIYMTNLLAVKVTRVISMTFALNLIYDNDVKRVKDDGTTGGAALQLQEVLGIGLSIKL